MKGKQLFEISNEGMEIFLRLRPDVESIIYPVSKEKITTGDEKLDRILGGGIRKYTNTLISGPTGSGKTTLALKFAESFLKNDQEHKLAFFSFEESPEILRNYAATLGFDVERFEKEERLEFAFLSPVELDLDYLSYRLMEKLYKLDAKAGVVLDSVTSFRFAQRDDIKYREFLWAVINTLKSQHCTSFLTYETEDPFGRALVTDLKLSLLADNIILIRYFQKKNKLCKAIGVLKMRGQEHDKKFYEIDFEKERGIAIGDVVMGEILK